MCAARSTWRAAALVVLGCAGPALAGPFIRGDANGDGRVDISDVVSVVSFLFLGGGPAVVPCEDAADADDSGLVDISDIHTLYDYLFLGIEFPPFPGPRVAGYDPTPDIYPCGDQPPGDCAPEASSTLPGVSIDLIGIPCTMTLEQAQDGIEFYYQVTAERKVPGVKTDFLMYSCVDRRGFQLLAEIHGSGGTFCRCDCGLGTGPTAADLEPGLGEGGFRWHGRSWDGPSDYGAGEGDPLPPGEYRFEVFSSGTYLDAGGNAVPYQVRASRALHLVP